MVQFVVDPSADDALDVGKIEDHAALVELLRLDHDHRPAVVAVQIAALAGVIQQAMAVTEVDFASDSKHAVGFIHG